jgi:hypothetical protein
MKDRANDISTAKMDQAAAHAPSGSAYPREHAAANGVGQWTEQKVSGNQSRTSANAAISTKNTSTALRSERTAIPIAQ